MAILKNIQTQYGIDAVYWNIGSIYIDTDLGIGRVIVKGYANKDGFKHLEERFYEEPLDDFIDRTFFKTFIYEHSTKTITVTREFDNPKAIDTNWILSYIYGLLKLKEEFLGSTDDI